MLLQTAVNNEKKDETKFFKSLNFYVGYQITIL